MNLKTVKIYAVLLILLIVSSCSPQSKLVGRWDVKNMENFPEFSPIALANNIEFFKDGTFSLTIEYFITQQLGGKYSFPDSQHVSLEIGGVTYTYEYELKGDMLKLMAPGGGFMEFTRSK